MCWAQGGTHYNTALLTAFVGKEVLKGKSLLGKEIDGGNPFPLFISANAAACSVPTALNAPERQLLQEQGWAVLHFTFLIQLHRLGRVLLFRGRYKAGSLHGFSASGRALGLPFAQQGTEGPP